MVIYLGNVCPGIFIKYVSLFFIKKCENKFKIIYLQWLFSLMWKRTSAIDLSPVLFPTVKDFLLFSCSVVFVQIDYLHVWFLKMYFWFNVFVAGFLIGALVFMSHILYISEF